MRWMVEVSSIGKTDLQKFCVEAESWQRALQAARAQRGEEGPMSGFSIELLEEGYRAVDPLARVRFVVKRAPDDMPITAPLAKDAKGTAPAAPATSVAPAAAAALSSSGGPTEPKLPPSPASSASSASSKKSVPPRPVAEKANGPASTQKKGLTFGASADIVPDTTRDPKIAAPKSEGKTKAPKSERPPPKSQRPPPPTPTTTATKSERPPPGPPSTPDAPLLPIGAFIPGLPSVKLLSSREQNPTEASPLTYREYSFAVAAGTSEEVGVDVLRGQLKIVDSHLSAAKMGKLVNLAVFDVEFTGKPPGPPLATLSWKDWKGEPVIGYPRRGAAQKQVKPPSGAPPAMSGPPSGVPVSNPNQNPTSQVAPTSGGPRPGQPGQQQRVATPNQSFVPQQPHQAAPPPQQQQVAQQAAPAPNPFAASPGQNPFGAAPNPFSSTSPLIPQALLPTNVGHHQPHQQHAQQPQQPGSIPPPAMTPSQPPGVGAGGIPIPVVAPVAMFTPSSVPPPGGSVPPPAFGSVPPPPAFPAPQVQHLDPHAHAQAQAQLHAQAQAQYAAAQQAHAQAQAAHAAHVAQSQSQPPPAQPRRPSYPAMPGPDGMVRTPSGRFVRGRTTGDELITALFESMHDLHFLRDALDGGQFCLALATEVLPARAAIIHFFDIEKREWVVACTRGKDTGRLLTMRTPENDELLREAARLRRAVVTANAAAAATAQRYQTLGGSRSMIIAPIMQAGRALGAIEIINPLDGMPFTEDEGHALTYIAEQYAEYLGSRGIVLDRDRIQSAATAR